MAIQANAIDFIDHIIEKLPFRIKEIRTDNTYENHDLPFAYIKQDTPPRNGKVERSHPSDGQKCHQLA